MISVNYQNTLKDLIAFKADVERRMKNMVAGFAYEVTLAASEQTPIGSLSDLMAGLSGQGSKAQRNYAFAYKRRQRGYGIETDVGFHKGAWFYSEQPSAPFDPRIRSGLDAANDAYGDASTQYQIGDDFYIVSSGPGFEALNNGYSDQAPDGIVAPALNTILKTYQINLQKYYQEG